MADELAFFNGRMVPASQARLTVYDLGVVMGATVTEMVRTFRHELYRLEDHLERLAHSLRYVRFEIGMTMSELGGKVRELVAHNAALVAADDELSLVIFITAGESPIYAGNAASAARLSPTVCAHTFPLPYELWAEKLVAGAQLVTPSIRHIPPQCCDPKIKYRSRMHYYLADQEARLVSPDASALLLDVDGNITETSSANFLVVEKGTIVSPSPRNTLAGVSRATVVELAKQLGIPFAVRDLQVFDAINADEALLASTPYCMMPVTRINGIEVGNGAPGPVYSQLIEAWSKLVGFDVRAQFLEGAKRRRSIT